MSKAGFYDLNGTATPSALPALPVLLERILTSGMRAVVRVPDTDMRDHLNRALWLWGGRQGVGFLAHGAEPDGFSAEDVARQPVWLTCEAENPNQAEVLVLVHGAEIFAAETYARCLFLFDGKEDSDLREQMLASYRQWQESGEAVWYEAGSKGWQETNSSDEEQ